MNERENDKQSDMQNYIKVDLYSVDQEIILSTKNCSVEGNRVMLKGIDLPKIEHRTLIRAIGYLRDGIVIMEGMVTISTDLQINLEILDLSETEERRQNIKVKAEFKSKIIKAYRNRISKREMIVDDVIQTRDVSVGGICFYSNRRFFRNQTIFFEFNQGTRPFAAEAIVLRKETDHGNLEYQYKYGCRLINLTESQQQRICEYVFKIEIENYKKTNR